MKPSTDLVRCYLQEVKRIPLLTREQEVSYSFQVREVISLMKVKKALTQSLQHSPTLEEWAASVNMQERELQTILESGEAARQKFIKANLRMVVVIAKKFQHPGLELLDLIQEGSLGLIRAVDKFDPTRGFKFSTYAWWWIRQAVTSAIALKSRPIRLPIHITEKLNKIKKAKRQLSQQLGRTPTLTEIAAESKLKPLKVREFLERSTRPISLNSRVDDEHDTELEELLEDTKELPEEVVIKSFLYEDLQQLAKALTSQQQKVFFLRLGENGQDLTPTQIGQQLALSRARVCEIEFQIIKRIRQDKSLREKLQGYVSA